MRWWALIVVAACGGKPAAETAKTSVGKKGEEPAKPVCITQPEDGASIVHASSDGTQLQYCIGETDCFALRRRFGLGEYQLARHGGERRLRTGTTC